MAFSKFVFQNAIKDTLNEPATNMINFEAGGVTIRTMGFRILDGMMGVGRLKVEVDPAKLPAGAAAVYDPGIKTIIGNTFQTYYIDQKATIVHECTHAYMDLLKSINNNFTILNLKDEAAAYLAGAIYTYVNSPNQSLTGNNNIHTVAYNIVKTKGLGKKTGSPPNETNALNPVQFTDAEVGPLHATIKSNPLYKNQWQLNSTLRGI